MKPGAKVARTASHSAHNGMCLWRVALAKSRPLSDLHRNGTAPKSEGFTLSSLLPPWPWTKPSRQSIQIFSSVALKLSLPRLQHLLVATPASVGGSTLVIVALCTRYSITPLRCFVGRLGSRRMALSVLAHKDLAASGKDCQAAEDCSRKRLQAVQLRHRGFRCQLAARQQLMPGETTSKNCQELTSRTTRGAIRFVVRIHVSCGITPQSDRPASSFVLNSTMPAPCKQISTHATKESLESDRDRGTGSGSSPEHGSPAFGSSTLEVAFAQDVRSLHLQRPRHLPRKDERTPRSLELSWLSDRPLSLANRSEVVLQVLSVLAQEPKLNSDNSGPSMLRSRQGSRHRPYSPPVPQTLCFRSHPTALLSLARALVYPILHSRDRRSRASENASREPPGRQFAFRKVQSR